jgi:hypothetical protein
MGPVPKERPDWFGIKPAGEGKREREMRLIQIQEQIGRGEYHVDSHAVADAIVRRLMEQYKSSLPEQKPVQGECS